MQESKQEVTRLGWGVCVWGGGGGGRGAGVQNLDRTLSPRPYIPRFSLKTLLVLEKKNFKYFFYRMGAWRPSCSMARQTNCQYPFDRMLHIKSGKGCSSGFREDDI